MIYKRPRVRVRFIPHKHITLQIAFCLTTTLCCVEVFLYLLFYYLSPIYKGQAKGKFTLEQVTKAQRGSRGI